MQDFNNIAVPSAKLPYTKHNYVSTKNAKYDNVDGFRGKFSLCYFQGTSFINASLKEATMLCSAFSEKTDLTGANVDGLLLLAASNVDGASVTRNWLQEKRALNADKAITSLEDLKEMLSNDSIKIETVELYRKRINNIYGLLNSVRLRYQNNMEIKPEWSDMLKQATVENLSILQNAYFLIDNYIINHVNKSCNTTNLDTINRMLLQNSCPGELTYEYKRDEKDQYFSSSVSSQKKYSKRAKSLADILINPRCPKKFTINFSYHSDNELEIIFNKLSNQSSSVNLHIIINGNLGKKDFDGLIKLLASPHCPKDLRIDINATIDISQYYKIMFAVMNNTAPKGLQFGFHVASNELALAILGYEEESILHNSRVGLHVLSHSHGLAPEVVDRINRLQTKTSALGCITLLQGNRDESHVLSVIPSEVLTEIFDFTLQSAKTNEQKKSYINKIWNSPIGSLFKINPQDAEMSILVKKYKLTDSSQESLEKGLRNAANNNSIADLKFFTKYVKNINAQDNNPTSRKTALHWAAEKGHTECVELLLEAGANSNVLDAKGVNAKKYIDLQRQKITLA